MMTFYRSNDPKPPKPDTTNRTKSFENYACPRFSKQIPHPIDLISQSSLLLNILHSQWEY